MDAIIKVCETNDIELEDIRKFISPVIKDKLEAEAMDLNFLPKEKYFWISNSWPIKLWKIHCFTFIRRVS